MVHCNSNDKTVGAAAADDDDEKEAEEEEEEERQEDTFRLTRLVDHFAQAQYQFFFLYGCGSNQHNQLLLNSQSDYLLHGEEAHELTEIFLASAASNNANDDDKNNNSTTTTTTTTSPLLPSAIFAGGGHSALLTTTGKLYLIGWNEAGQYQRQRH